MSSLTCYCDGTCGDDVSCEGNVCFVRLTNVHHNGHIVQDIDYGCFESDIGGVTSNHSGVCAGDWHNNFIFKCCSNANFCNENLTIEAQSSSSSISSPSISLSISPSPTGIFTIQHYILCSVNIHTYSHVMHSNVVMSFCFIKHTHTFIFVSLNLGIPENTENRFILSIWIILTCILIPLSLVIIFILIVVMVKDFKKCRKKYKKQRQMTTAVSSQVILI